MISTVGALPLSGVGSLVVPRLLSTVQRHACEANSTTPKLAVCACACACVIVFVFRCGPALDWQHVQGVASVHPLTAARGSSRPAGP